MWLSFSLIRVHTLYRLIGWFFLLIVASGLSTKYNQQKWLSAQWLFWSKYRLHEEDEFIISQSWVRRGSSPPLILTRLPALVYVMWTAEMMSGSVSHRSHGNEENLHPSHEEKRVKAGLWNRRPWPCNSMPWVCAKFGVKIKPVETSSDPRSSR